MGKKKWGAAGFKVFLSRPSSKAIRHLASDPDLLERAGSLGGIARYGHHAIILALAVSSLLSMAKLWRKTYFPKGTEPDPRRAGAAIFLLTFNIVRVVCSPLARLELFGLVGGELRLRYCRD